jgi:hypothetical protein
MMALAKMVALEKYPVVRLSPFPFPIRRQTYQNPPRLEVLNIDVERAVEWFPTIFCLKRNAVNFRHMEIPRLSF